MTAQPNRGNERTIRIFSTFHFRNIFNDLVDHPSKLTTPCIRPDCPLEKDLWDLAAMQGADDNSPENFAFFKQTMSSMLGGSEVPCPVNIWWTAAEDIERFIQDQSWATLKNKIRNAKLSKNDIVLKLKDFMDDHNAELNARDPALVSAHSGYFNDHFGHYPQRYHVNDVNDYHVDDYLYTYPRVGYGNGYGYGYEHVHPLMQPQLSTSSGNDSMQY
eukprot:854225_1